MPLVPTRSTSGMDASPSRMSGMHVMPAKALKINALAHNDDQGAGCGPNAGATYMADVIANCPLLGLSAHKWQLHVLSDCVC